MMRLNGQTIKSLSLRPDPIEEGRQLLLPKSETLMRTVASQTSRPPYWGPFGHRTQYCDALPTELRSTVSFFLWTVGLSLCAALLTAPSVRMRLVANMPTIG